MRILLVEDDATMADVLAEEFGKLGIDILHAASRSDAEQQIFGTEEFDLAIVDQRIPANTDELATDESHGRSVVRTLRAHRSGIPVVVFSAYQPDPQELVSIAQQVDVFGTRELQPMLAYYEKNQLIEFLELVAQHRDEIESLSNIELDTPEDLDHQQQKAIRIFARRRGGAQVRMRFLRGGLSASCVVQLVITNAQGRQLNNVLAKIDTLEEVAREVSNFQQHVTNLNSQYYAGQVDTVTAGAGRYGAIVYDYAMEGEQIDDVFTFLKANQGNQRELVDRIKTSEARWQQGLHQIETTVGHIVSSIVGDEHDAFDLIDSANCPEDVDAESLAADLRALWDRPVSSNWMCQHGDLHGANVLLRPDGSVVLIDFARVGDASAALDPISLEMSLLFHPEMCEATEWSRTHTGVGWRDPGAFAAECPYQDFVFACREWSEDVAGGPRAKSSTTLGYTIRQLRFERLRHPRALRIARDCLDMLAASYR